MDKALNLFGKNVVTFVVSALWIGLATGWAIAATSASDSFLHQFEQFAIDEDSSALDWVGPDSPWYPYLGRDFAEGIPSGSRAQFENAVRQGRCDMVLTQLQRGLLGLYPDLLLLFANERVRTNFEDKILKQHASAYQRCRAHEMMIPVIEAAKRRMPGDEMFFGLLPSIYLYGQVPDPSPGWTEEDVAHYSRGIRQLVHLAVCRHDAGALQDLFDLAKNFHFMYVFSEADALYLESLAEQAEIAAPFHSLMREQAGLNSGESFHPAQVRALRARLASGNFEEALETLPRFKALCANNP